MMQPGQLLCGAVLLLSACTEDKGMPWWSSDAGALSEQLADAAGALDAGTAGSGMGTSSAKLLAHPNPIVSRGKPTFSLPLGGAAVVDGNYHGGGWFAGANPTADAPGWVAIHLGEGLSRLLVVWDDGGTYNYQDPPGTTVYGLPGAYRLEVSSDSTNGQDGSWATAVTVTDNAVRTRGHSIDFSGRSWLKLSVTGKPPTAANGVTIAEIDVHDISATGADMPDDTWLFMGDSITAYAYDRASAHQPSFAAGVNAFAPGYFPAMINAGIGGELVSGALARLESTLRLNPDYRFVVLGYGTNDAAGNQVPVATFKMLLQVLINGLKTAGRVPVIPHIPPAADGNHAGIPQYNVAIDELVLANDLPPGADLYRYFNDTSGLFVCPPCGGGRTTDNLHPNDDGLKGMNAAWTLAMRALYPGSAAN